ncbi:tRNA (adenine(58)-N(1))-methyltransferase non-catalytic subunit TRM6 [Galendromus occidentalis]|uniref:tRNA (adenine(58)-N(1))-methyltransferase non-catalytic subunit TRM6 n=1 Tax=Galendromus occidentalis TaxID=34638 RepID=A0AAJ6QU07_9ACAR|nr:tRNA (adenine(58)-N(1))-methyltransferase non-catalytic subunit TRM6 [Galendromus occidentalis]
MCFSGCIRRVGHRGYLQLICCQFSTRDDQYRSARGAETGVSTEIQSSFSNMTAESLIKENDFAILKTGKAARLVQLNKGAVYVEKRKFNCQDIIGHPWGQVFAITCGKKGEATLSVVPRQDYVDHIFNASEKVGSSTSGQDNRDILDENRSQKLTREEITKLKQDGASSVDIVRSLVENSDTFSDKTNYSQQKYLQKKLKKYDSFFQACRPTVRLLSELYWSQNPLKVGMLRPDSLASVLASANILGKGKYIVMDSFLGLLTAGVLQHCAEGQVIQVLDYMGYQSSTRQAVQAIGLDSTRLLSVDYHLVEKLASGLKLREDCPEDPMNDRRVTKFQKNMEALSLLQQRDFAGLIMNCRGDIVEPCVLLLKFLRLSGTFVVFSPHLGVITNLYDTLKSKGGCVMLKVSESWIRGYQVLENRTHPVINMQGASGFILTGIKCE